MQHFVCSDIHGHMDLFNEIMGFLNEKDSYQLFMLGDACDRQPFGYEIMIRLLENPNVVYLKGNHEDMFVRAARSLNDISLEESLSKEELLDQSTSIIHLMERTSDMSLYRGNGGAETFKDWIMAGGSMAFVNKIDKLPLFATYENFDMCHAGCTRKEWESKDVDSMLWSRNHFFAPWFPDRILIHGHTPIAYLPSYMLKLSGCNKRWIPVHYYDNSKIDMDTACFTTNVISLFNLDTEETVTFAEDENHVNW